MLKERTFNVDVVGAGATKAVKYVGEKVAVKP
jgi:hypothetical protein